jgi:hypothetical protein
VPPRLGGNRQKQRSLHASAKGHGSGHGNQRLPTTPLRVRQRTRFRASAMWRMSSTAELSQPRQSAQDRQRPGTRIGIQKVARDAAESTAANLFRSPLCT